MNRREFAKNALLASTSLVSAKAGLSSLADRLTSEAGSNPLQFKKLFTGKDLTNFVDVNTSKENWFVEDGILKCTGWPLGVMRTEKQYETFILDIEWRSMEEGGNAGCFLCADGVPYNDNECLPGVEV